MRPLSRQIHRIDTVIDGGGKRELMPMRWGPAPIKDVKRGDVQRSGGDG
jgi:hypothetical protein